MPGSGKPFHASVILQGFAQIVANSESFPLSGTTLHVDFLQDDTELKGEDFVEYELEKKYFIFISPNQNIPSWPLP